MKVYVIQDPTNNHWYTENHSIPAGDRWSPNFLDAHQHASRTDAEDEIAGDTELDNTYYRIIEIETK